MLNISDNELDRISREAAERYEPEHESLNAWSTLEQKLDRELGSIPKPGLQVWQSAWRFSRVWLLLAAATASYFLVPLEKRTKPTNQLIRATDKAVGPAQNQASSQNPISTKTDTKIDIPKGPKDEVTTRGTSEVRGAVSDAGVSRHKWHLKADPYSKHQVTAIKEGLGKRDLLKPIKQSDHSAGVSLSDANGRKGKSPATNPTKNAIATVGGLAYLSQEHGRSTGNFAHSSNERYAESENGTTRELSYLAIGKLATIETQQPTSPAFSGVQLAVFDSSLAKAHADLAILGPVSRSAHTLNVNRSLKVGLLVAPDYSDVGEAPNGKLSSNLGVTVSYALFGKWWISTGFIYTKKNYGIEQSDFKAPVNSAYVPLGCQIYHMDGTCYMFEIPLTLRRDFVLTSKSKFFISGGPSSYLMRKENYKVYYAPSTGVWGGGWFRSGLAQTQFPGYKPTNYWFSTLSFSAGIETEINQSLSFQIEPFAKIPLRGIGIGDIPLSSYGLAFSLRYAPVLGRSRN